MKAETTTRNGAKFVNYYDVQSAKYDDFTRYGSANPCHICGREIADSSALMVHMTTDAELTTATESEVDNSQGFFPIGSGCARKLAKAFIFGHKVVMTATQRNEAAIAEALLEPLD